MTTRLLQFKNEAGERRVGLVGGDEESILPLKSIATVFELASRSIETGVALRDLVADLPKEEPIDYSALLVAGYVLAPLDHPEPSRFLITGTGLTHTGSAMARNHMHLQAHGPDAHESDSMKIFRMGLAGGKPRKGEIGVQPEWFFKGVGTCVVPPEGQLELPGFALAGAEEAEIVGLYIVDREGRPRRIGFTASCQARSVAIRASIAAGEWFGKKSFFLARTTCLTQSPTWSITTFATQCFAGRVTCTPTSSGQMR
jgi:hypothetical protein